MLIVGSILHGVKLKEVLTKECFYYSFFRLAVVPALMFLVLTLLKASPLVTGVVVLSSAMPAALTTAMLAEKYGQDAAFASKVVFVSTILSMATLPILTTIVNRFAPV
jgi:predicted permease